jgi:hypothetical protein
MRELASLDDANSSEQPERPAGMAASGMIKNELEVRVVAADLLQQVREVHHMQRFMYRILVVYLIEVVVVLGITTMLVRYA